MNNFQYFGLFLGKRAKNKLHHLVFNLPDCSDDLREFPHKIFLDHCTVLHKSQLSDNHKLYSRLECNLGEYYKVKITAIGASSKALAFKVELPQDMCANKTPHITIATFIGGKPVDSNYIKHWKEIEPIEIMTRLEKR